jgi:hypothetical protein
MAILLRKTAAVEVPERISALQLLRQLLLLVPKMPSRVAVEMA